MPHYSAIKLDGRGEIMTLKRLAILPSILIVAFSAYCQQTLPTATQDPQAVAVLQQSVKVMGGTPPGDSVTSGTVQVVAGSQTTNGTIRILTRNNNQTLIQMNMPDGTTTEIYSQGQANQLAGSVVSIEPLELAVTSQAPDFPLTLLSALLSDTDTSFQYVALETSNGASLHHVRTWDSFASLPAIQLLASFTVRDIWIDASSGLVQRISYSRRSGEGDFPSMAVDFYYSGYQTAAGISYPYAIQESLNGTPWATITIQAVSFNTGLTDADFPVQ